jgi:hypothetical protein
MLFYYNSSLTQECWPNAAGKFNAAVTLPMKSIKACAAHSETSRWLGWATTTQFGSGDGPWGNVDGEQISLTKVNDKTIKNSMGGAVPWRIICKQWGGKTQQISQTVASALGKPSNDSCWLIQPIRAFPDEIS